MKKHFTLLALSFISSLNLAYATGSVSFQDGISNQGHYLNYQLVFNDGTTTPFTTGCTLIPQVTADHASGSVMVNAKDCQTGDSVNPAYTNFVDGTNTPCHDIWVDDNNNLRLGWCGGALSKH